MSSVTRTRGHAQSTADPADPDPIAAGLAVDRRPGATTTLVRRVLPLMLLAAVFAVLARFASRPLSNPDTFFHLRFGHELLTGAWSLRDPGSVTSQGTAHWLPTQWSAQLLMAQMEQWFGLPGVAWFSGLQFVVLASCLYAAARRFSDPLVASTLTIVAVLASTPGLSPRPQVLSYAFVAICATLWCGRAREGRTPWVIVPLTWVWATYHGMWPLGIILGLTAVVGLWMDRAVDRRTSARHLAVVVGSAVAGALTPLGPALYSAVLSVNSRSAYFSEWSPPHFTQINNLAALAVVGVTVGVSLRTGRRDWTTIAMLGLSGALLVYSQRTVPVAVALVLPLTAQAFQGLIGTRSRMPRSELAAVVVAALVPLAVLAIVAPATARNPAPQPTWVQPALSALPAGTPVLSDISFGGYLMWADPRLDIVLSGYGDIYTDAEMERNATIGMLAPGWDDDVRSTGARIALTSPEESLGYALKNAGWSVVHTSRTVQLLAAPPDWSQ